MHLWKISVISQLRTNFAEMPGNRSDPGAANSRSSFEDVKGDAVVRVSRMTTPVDENRVVWGPRTEADIEIGHS